MSSFLIFFIVETRYNIAFATSIVRYLSKTFLTNILKKFRTIMRILKATKLVIINCSKKKEKKDLIIKKNNLTLTKLVTIL